MKIDVFQNFQNNGTIELERLLSAINGGTFKKEITHLRNLVIEGEKDEAKRKKEQLWAFTPCGTFKDSRESKNLQSYNKLVVLDYDKIPDGAYDQAFEKIVSEPTTYSAFRSPSGNGVKVLVKVSTDKHYHKDAFILVAKHYEALTGLQIDKCGKDLSRLCYVSYDKDLYLNEVAEIFKTEIPVTASVDRAIKGRTTYKSTSTTKKNINKVYTMVKKFTEQKEKFEEGNRNNFVYQLACNSNRAGISLAESVSSTHNEYGNTFDADEILKTIKSAYKNTADFGTDSDRYQTKSYTDIAEIADIAPAQIDDLKDDMEKLPYIPDEVFGKLPDLLKKGCTYFEDLRQRDLFLTGALGVLSGCMKSIYGRYHTTVLYPNLYVFITAPAGSGKGALTHTRKFGFKYHQELTSLSDKNKAKKLLFIPGNSSAAALTSHLEENNGQGLFFETEADTLSNTFKQEWGNFSDLLRKAFHHEPVSYTRKGNNEYIEINKPKLSVVLSGTPGQIQGLIKSSEDGLFSRFLFYAFKASSSWEDVKPSNNKNIHDFIDELSDKSYDIIKNLNAFEAVSFKLKDEQWDTLNKVCSNCLAQVTTEFGDGAGSLVKRMEVMWFRIALILTALTNHDNIDENKGLLCSDIDFEIAKKLILTYKEHILHIYSTLPNKEIGNNNKEKFLYNALPDGEFERQYFIELAKCFKIGTRNADNLIKSFKAQALIKRVRHGVYVRA